MRQATSFPGQRGYLLMLAVVFILVIGVMGVIISYSYANRARLAVAQQDGLQAFYIAESGLEVATRLLVGMNRVSGQALSCATLTGSSLVTNAAMLNGTFTATAIGGGLYSASTILSAPITSSSNSMTVASVTGMASHGRVRIDNEAIDYASMSGTTLTGLNRGAGGTIAANHSSGAPVTESVCLVNVQTGIPSIASPQYQRQLEMAVEVVGADIWAVGARISNKFSIIRWNTPIANAWNDYSIIDVRNSQDLKSVSLSSATNGWAVGVQKSSNFTLVRWSGTSWAASPLAGACKGQDLNGVVVTSTSEAWAVGARYRTSCANHGATNWNYTVLKWNGSSWSNLASPSVPGPSSSSQNLNAIDVYDSNGDGLANYGFAVGDAGSILSYTGSTWVTSVSGVTDNLYGISVVSGLEAWAVGANGRILKWNGTAWSTVSSPTVNQLNAIRMIDTNGDGAANLGWAVGNNGTILYYNGSTWATQTSSTTNTLSGVAAQSNSSAYAVGASSTLLIGSASSWSSTSSPITTTYYGIGMVPGGIIVTGSQVGAWRQTFR